MSDLPPVVIMGVGYVGLPLSCALAAATSVTAYDRDPEKIERLRAGTDITGSVPPELLRQTTLMFTDDPSVLSDAEFIIVSVPTPVDRQRQPDLSAVIAASEIIGQHIGIGTTVVFESTVFPGATEEVCVPTIERESGMKAGQDFQVGYSPERISPGDATRTIRDVVKIVAAPDDGTLELMERVYSAVTSAGVYRLSDIRTAEAAKIIENVQRDVNIALMNELAMVFHLMGLNTNEVLAAAETKWNFAPYRPGLVGGHCIGVDPYYFSHKAVELGYTPKMVLSGRRINDNMGAYVAQQTVSHLIAAGKTVQDARVLVLGLTYKENVPDTRNTLTRYVIEELLAKGVEVAAHDPLVEPEELAGNMNVTAMKHNLPASAEFDALVLAVPHRAYLERSTEDYMRLLQRSPGSAVVIDVKGALNRDEFEAAGALHWEL